MRLAFSGWPFRASHRGLSGTDSMPRKKSSEGTAVTPNIQRHPVWPFHEFRISSADAPVGTGLAMIQFMNWANKIPITIVS